MKSKRTLFPLAIPLGQRMNLFALCLLTFFVTSCGNNDTITTRERLIEHDWENVEVTGVRGIPMDVYTGVYNFSADSTFTQTLDDSIVSGKWELKDEVTVVFNKEDIAKKRFWNNIEISEGYLRVLNSTIDRSSYDNFGPYDINGTNILQNEAYIPVE